MPITNERRKFSGEDKMALLRGHLVKKRAVSDVHDEADPQDNQQKKNIDRTEETLQRGREMTYKKPTFSGWY